MWFGANWFQGEFWFDQDWWNGSELDAGDSFFQSEQTSIVVRNNVVGC
jgi:hypothetical protein